MECYHRIRLKNGTIVPCGRCPACLANLRQEWIFRLKEEYKACTFAIFVTLTYNDENLPLDLSVNKRDVQLFHKRLRKHFPSGDMRYYLVSEYGDHTFRPHYHGLYFFKSNYDKDFIYRVFEESWQNGFIKFGEVETGSIVYCTKYCLKHSSTPPGRKSTFRLVSKMSGGLGSSYLDKMSDYHKESKNLIFVAADGRACRMPRYYRNILDCNKGGFKYNPLHIQKENEQYSENSNKFYQSYLEYSKKHLANDIKDFENHLNKVHQQRDELVLKHIKKQKF